MDIGETEIGSNKAMASVIALSLEQDILEYIAEGEHAFQVVALVDDDETVDAGLPNRVEDGVKAVIEGTGVDSRKILV